MTQQELTDLIRGGENSVVEFKRDGLRAEKLAKEIVAFANLKGGTLLLGVEDDGSISGISRENLSEWIFDTVIGRYVHPLLLPYYEEISIEGKTVAVLDIPQGSSKPYVVRSSDREDVYIRLGSVTKLAGREQQARLYATGGMLHTEILPVPGTGLYSLDRARLENYLRDLLREPEMPTTNEKWIERLQGLGFLTVDGAGATVCTIAGLVLFGIRPRQALRQAGIRLMAFKGLDKEYQALLDVVLDAPLVGRWQIDETHRRLIDAGLIEKFIDQISPFISQEAAEIDEHFRREKSWGYPLDAVRETVVNALAHRDWTRSVDIEVGVYIDRMEVISPGALPNSMSIEKVVAGQRSARNQIIMEVLRDYGYVDSRGMGVRTKVIPLMRAAGSEAQFDATEDYFKTTLCKQSDQTAVAGSQLAAIDSVQEPTYNTYRSGSTDAPTRSGSTATPARIGLLETLRQSPHATYDELAAVSGISPATVKRRIQVLKKEGLVQRVGSKKTGHWQVGADLIIN
jgi:ATP-dependent DNA helicase RecG